MSAKFNLDDIEKILEMLSDNDVTEFRLEREGEKIWLKRGKEEIKHHPIHHIVNPMHGSSNQPIIQYQQQDYPQQQQQLPVVNGSAEAQKQEAAKNYHVVSSPMVGTFYRRPAVDADAYVEIGDTVKKGDVLCIVEAMKLMNEIESEVSGKVVEICLDDAQMVEYGEVLFRIEPA